MPCPKSSTRRPRYGASCVGVSLPAMVPPCRQPLSEHDLIPKTGSHFSGSCSQRQIALPDVDVGLQLFDGGCVDDLALVDNRRVARKAKAKMHVLLGDQHGGAGRAELAQPF